MSECGERFRAAVHEQDAHGRGVEGSEVTAQASGRELADLARDLYARWSGADHDDGQPSLFLDGVGRRFGHLERAEDTAPDLERVIDRLHSRGVQRELVVTEVRLTDARGHDQAVVGHFDRSVERAGREDDAPVEIEAGDFGELDANVLVALQRVAQRHRDLTLGENGGGDVVQQRLEQMMVAPVEEHDVDRLSAEEPAGGQAPEPPPTTTTRCLVDRLSGAALADVTGRPPVSRNSSRRHRTRSRRARDHPDQVMRTARRGRNILRGSRRLARWPSSTTTS